MAADDKKAKTAAPKPESPKEAPKKDKSAPADAPSKADAPAKAESKADAAPKAEATKADAAPANYSRGEGQKPVSQAYKDNWNAIFAKKAKKKKKR